ncbi:MAG: alpha-N-arabinofuranosidase [Candidatus Acidiferrum sp.]
MSNSRRRFLQQVSSAGVGLTASRFLGDLLPSQSPAANQPALAFVDSRRTLPPLDRNLFGSFLEHLGRAIYEGIYDPASKLSDSSGFRKDVMDEIRKLAVPTVRYPGGNFVSGYHWLDGVGPKDARPRALDKAWNTIETNQFGTNEFLAWCKAVGTQPLLAVNLGTGTPESAAALVEYCNMDKGTQWSDLRRKHGIAESYKVQNWCLGNEMDGPWQIGHMSATEYGLKAADAARQMRYVDNSLKLIACGSSGPTTATYLEWDREVLEQCYEYVDAISLHRYFDNRDGDSAKFLALNLSMEQQIAEVAAVCDTVRGRRRSPKKLWLSFDEWNVWYRARGGAFANGNKQEAPHLLEEIYNLEDALLVGGVINTLLRNSERVRVGCLAQLINVIAPIMTSHDGLFRQTIYYPYSWALQYARGAALQVLLENSPSYDVKAVGQVPYLDVAGTLNSADGTVSLFVLNRDLSKAHQVEVKWEDKPGSRLLASWVLTGDDLKAVNSFTEPQKVVPKAAEKPSTSGGRTVLEVPPRSYSVFQWGL